MDNLFHAYHEAGHAIVGRSKGLTPKLLEVGLTSLGTRGGVQFCSSQAVRRDRLRYLLIAIAGQVATRVAGYRNRLVSEQLTRNQWREPGHMSDAWYVWESGYSLAEIRTAEAEVKKVLKARLSLLHQLADSLSRKGKLTKTEIADLVG